MASRKAVWPGRSRAYLIASLYGQLDDAIAARSCRSCAGRLMAVTLLVAHAAGHEAPLLGHGAARAELICGGEAGCRIWEQLGAGGAAGPSPAQQQQGGNQHVVQQSAQQRAQQEAPDADVA